MKKTSFVALASLSLLALLPVAAAAGPADIVPRGNIAYDLLGSLAAKGTIPGVTLRDFFRGDRLYTRRELAAFVQQLRQSDSDSLSAEDRFALRVLEIEFRVELGRGSESSVSGPLKPKFTGAAKARALTDPEAGSLILRTSASAPIGRDAYATLMIGSFREEWYSKSGPQKGGYPPIESAYIRANGRFLDVSVGRMPLRWGPGYVGGMLLSDDSVSLNQIRVEKTFRLPGTLGRHIGQLRFEQFNAEFYEDDLPGALPYARGTRRYLLGRRLETAGDGRFSLSLGESFKSTRLPSPLFANILPFYLYQAEWTKTSRGSILGDLVDGALPDTGWLNYLADVNLSYRTDNRGSFVYGDFLLDDVKAPSGIGLPGRGPDRKIGVQAGFYAPDLGGAGGKYGLRLEFATIDAGTYANASFPAAYGQNGINIGHPAGPNAEVYFGRFDLAATPKLKLAVEGTVRRRKDNSVPSPKSDRLGLYASYSLRNNAFVGARFEHSRQQNGATATGNRAEINAGIGF